MKKLNKKLVKESLITKRLYETEDDGPYVDYEEEHDHINRTSPEYMDYVMEAIDQLNDEFYMLIFQELNGIRHKIAITFDETLSTIARHHEVAEEDIINTLYNAPYYEENRFSQLNPSLLFLYQKIKSLYTGPLHDFDKE